MSEPARIRTFALLGVAGTPFALGKSSSSWFLCLAKRGSGPARPQNCLNFISSTDTLLADSPGGRPRFVLNCGEHVLGNRDVLQLLLALRDTEGAPPIRLTQEARENLPVVEVVVPRQELIRGCAHCGVWEALNAPRFQECVRCHARHYCSNECEMDDWHEQLHRADCAYIQAGREHGVVARRKPVFPMSGQGHSRVNDFDDDPRVTGSLTRQSDGRPRLEREATKYGMPFETATKQNSCPEETQTF